MIIQVRRGTTTTSVEIETLDDLFSLIKKNGGKAKIYKESWTLMMPKDWMIEFTD